MSELAKELGEVTEAATPQERQAACLMHIAAVFFPWVSPMVGLIVAGKSRYLRFHSWNSLVGEVLACMVIGVVVASSLGYSLWNLYRQYQEGFRDFNIWAIVVKSVVVWLGLFLFGVWNTVSSLVSAYRSLKGVDWGGRGIADRLARRWSGGG